MQPNQYQQASIATHNDLQSIAQRPDVQALSRLSLPEIDAAVNIVADMVPAGNIPGLILSGLARLPGNKPPLKIIHRDMDLLFRGVHQALDQAVYGAFFAGPAAVIWGYQNLLKLAGKDPDDSFPEGTWQFYVDYALREDTARHANETHGFDSLLNEHHVQLGLIDRMTSWTMAAIYTLHQYPRLLENEWRERVYTFLLRELTGSTTDGDQYANLYGRWEKLRPYKRGQDATSTEDYPRYRRLKFDRFLADGTQNLTPALFEQWQQAIRHAEIELLPPYQAQMSILAYLNPHNYGEERVRIALEQVHVGLIFGNHYYLLPICQPNTTMPVDVQWVRGQIATLVQFPDELPTSSLTNLARTKRATLAKLKQKLPAQLTNELNELRYVPILLNFEQTLVEQPLAQIRQAERGIGDHALTLFDTGSTFVFDQSHIFFDGAWGVALAEIMTNEALAWAVYLNGLPPAQPQRMRPYSPHFTISPANQKVVDSAPKVMPEASAENDAIRIKAMLALRKLFKQRSDLLQLTINDLLILYCAIHAVVYEPDPQLRREVENLPAQDPAFATFYEQYNPAILIPVDASQRSPRDRLYPMNFEVPLVELNLLRLHRQSIEALNDYESSVADRSAAYAEFDQLQHTYLGTLAGFGEVMSRAKEIAITGESASVGSIRLLAHMPTPLQRLLDQVPNRLDMLNDIIKGREVFSNVGAVAKTSTLTRFISAKDDNEKKTLVWGVLTDAQGTMRISLRDFRPYVGVLYEQGQFDLAQRLAQDYLDSYVEGLNQYIADLRRVTATSRETLMYKGNMDFHVE